MKKYLKVLCAVLLISSCLISGAVCATDGIKVSVDGRYIEFDVEPQIINDRTMVPLRAIFEELGAEVEWDENTKSVTAIKNDVLVIATIGSKKISIDGDEKMMDVAPVIVDGRTLVPARFVAEAYSCDVEWDARRKTVYITTEEMEENFYFVDQE